MLGADSWYAIDIGFGRFDNITLENLKFTEVGTTLHVL
jgi:hypothetical protein